MTQGYKDRLRLFKRYSTNLNLHFRMNKPVYVCPTCLRGFEESSVLGPKLLVDFGHAYPDAAGGNLGVLECRECNGRMNLAGDNAIVQLHRIRDSLAAAPGSKPLSATMHSVKGSIPVLIHGNVIRSHHLHADPKIYGEVINASMGSTGFELEIPHPPQEKINIGIMHAVHLMFFREFGYAYLFRPIGKLIQRVLKENSTDLPFLSLDIEHNAGISPDIIFNVGIATLKSGERCLFAALPNVAPQYFCQFILIPGPWDKDIEIFNELRSKDEHWLRADFKTIGGAAWQRLCHSEYSYAMEQLWRGWNHSTIEVTALMDAIKRITLAKTNRSVDVKQIASGMGIRTVSLDQYIEQLSERGYIERRPKRKLKYRISLTTLGLQNFWKDGSR